MFENIDLNKGSPSFLRKEPLDITVVYRDEQNFLKKVLFC